MASPQQIAARLAVVPAAQAAMSQYGVPASVTLAQWELESGWGTSKLATEANNFFGIKAEHLNDPNTYEEFPTWEYENGQRVLVEADFERYPDAASSFADHGRLLSQATRYAPAMAVKDDPYAFANELQACGYSSSPDYGTSLGNIIRGANLTQYDLPQGG
jgi:flagellum-specific peptidoglycan hydrolase FlgJ